MAGFFNPFAGGAGGKAPTASEIPYDGSSSGISATDVQGAIDEVQENIENIPRPMSYQGTLGVGGEITELPAPSEANRGYTYKVVTAGTYQGITAEVGDTFISYATRWDLVPSGDEPGGTVLSVGVTSNDGSVTVTGSPITTAGSIDVSVNADNELSDTSTKPVQNKIVTLAINEKLDIDDAVGKNVTGTEYTIDGQTVIAGNGAEIFNDYANNKAAGLYSHAEGNVTTASGDYSHAEGRGAKASGENSHAEGFYTKATGNASHAEGSSNASGQYSHAEGSSSNASGQNSHAEGSSSNASGRSSHAEGNNSKASGSDSHAEGYGTMAVGDDSHAEGQGGASKNYTSSTSNSTILSDYSTYPFTLAKGRSSHCEGSCTLALGECSHSEGYRTKSVSDYSHAEGSGTRTDGDCSHAEGSGTNAYGGSSHAEGGNTTARGNYSHAEGYQTNAASAYQHVQGRYNVEDANDTYAFIIGNGTSTNARHNAFAIDWNGNIYVNGSATGVNVETLSSILNPISESAYEALTTKDKPLYFIYD